MAGDPDEDALRSDISLGRTGSWAGPSSTNHPQEGHQRGQPIPQQHPSAVPAHESEETRKTTHRMPTTPPVNTKGSKAVSWADIAAHGAAAKGSSTTDASRSNTRSRATNPTALQQKAYGRVAPSAPAQADEIREQDTTPMPPSKGSNVSGQEGSGPLDTVTPLPQPDSSTVEADARTEDAAEHGRLREMKYYLRELTEAHGLPLALVEHLSDEESETTLETVDALFKDFALRLSKECREKERNLKSTEAKLDKSTSAQATLEKEKLALEEAARVKDTKLKELESIATQARDSDIEDPKAQVERCAIERDEATSELRGLQKKLEAAESERDEKDILTQRLNSALQEAQQSNRQAAPSDDVEALKTTISNLREQLRDLNSDKADLERQAEMIAATQKHKGDEHDAQMRHQDEFILGMQKENEKYKMIIEALQREKEEQLRKASVAEAERQPVTFRVDNEVLPLERYEKLLGNARGDAAELREQLQQAEEERDRALEDFKRARQMIMEEFVPLYNLAVEEATANLINIGRDEETRLLGMVGKGEYRRYLRAVVEPDREVSPTSSEGFVAPGEVAAGLGLDGSPTLESTSPTGQRSLASEMSGLGELSDPSELSQPSESSQPSNPSEHSRESSVPTEDSQMGRGDDPADLSKALDECHVRRKKAEQRAEELEDEMKKQRGEIEALQDEIQTLKDDAAEVATPSVDGSAELQKALDDCQSRQKEADQRIKELEGEMKAREGETARLQDEIQKLKDDAAAVAKASVDGSAKLQKALKDCQTRLKEADEKSKKWEYKAKEQEEETKGLQDEIQRTKQAAETSRDGSAKLHDALDECRRQRDEADQRLKELRGEAKRQKDEIEELQDKIQKLEEAGDTAKTSKGSGEESDAPEGRAQTPTQGIAKHEDAAKQDVQQLQEASEGKGQDMQADLNECQAHRQQADREVEELKGEGRRRSRELKKLKGELSLQQRIEKVLKERLRAVQAKASKANAKVKWAETRVMLQGEGADDEEEISSSTNDSESYLKLVSALSQRVEEAESRFGIALRELQEARTMTITLQAIVEQLESLRGQLEQEAQQLREVSQAHRQSEQEPNDDEELREVDGEIEEMDEAIRKKKEELEKKNEEFQEKGKALDDCRANDEELKAELATLTERRDGDTEDDDTEDDDGQNDLGKEIDGLKEEVGDLQRQLSAAKYRASREESRRRGAEDELSVATAELKSKETELKSKGTELEVLKWEYDDLGAMYEELDEWFNRRIDEAKRVKLEHQQIVYGLEVKLWTAEKQSRGQVSELARIKLEHAKALDEANARCDASEAMIESLEDRLRDMMPGGHVYGPLRTYLMAYLELKARMESDLGLQNTATALQDYLLVIVEKLDQELARRVMLSRVAMANRPETPDGSKDDDSSTDDESHSPSPGDRVAEDSDEEKDEDPDDNSDKGEDERAAILRDIRETCKGFEDMGRRMQWLRGDDLTAIHLVSALEAEIKARKESLNGADDSDEKTAEPDDGDDEPDKSDDDEKDAEDPAAIRRRIARLRKKVSKTKTNLKDEEALRSAVSGHERDLAKSIDNMDDLDGDPERALYHHLADGTAKWLEPQTGSWNGSTYVRPVPLPSMEVISAIYKLPNTREEKPRADGSPGLEAAVDEGELDEPTRRQGPQEARSSRGPVEGTDGEPQETVMTLGDENDSLRERERAAEQAIADRAAQEERQRQLEKELTAARARTEAEKAENKTLAEEKERLQEAVERMEKLKEEAIRDGLDREMRETLQNYEELKKEAAGLRKGAADLREKLSNELLTRSGRLETAQSVIEGMAGRIDEADKRAAVAEDMRAKLARGVERALDMDAEDNARSLERLRRAISDILNRAPEETDGGSGGSAGDKGQEEEERERAMEEYGPSTGREHELVQKILDERKKGAEDLAAAKKAHEERMGRRLAEHERRAEDSRAMLDAAERARGLSETNLVEAVQRVRELEVEAGRPRRADGASAPGDGRKSKPGGVEQAGGSQKQPGGDADDGPGSTTRGCEEGGRCTCSCILLCDTKERMRNEGRHYAARVLLAFWGCARAHLLSWGQTAGWAARGLAYCAGFCLFFFLPEGRWKPGRPRPGPGPQRVATVVGDAVLVGLLWYTYRVLAATWAVQRVWGMANGYTRAYFVERAVHPERSRWFGIGGADMRLGGGGFPSEPGTAPHSAAIGHGRTGWWAGRS